MLDRNGEIWSRAAGSRTPGRGTLRSFPSSTVN